MIKPPANSSLLFICRGNITGIKGGPYQLQRIAISCLLFCLRADFYTIYTSSHPKTKPTAIRERAGQIPQNLFFGFLFPNVVSFSCSFLGSCVVLGIFEIRAGLLSFYIFVYSTCRKAWSPSSLTFLSFSI